MPPEYITVLVINWALNLKDEDTWYVEETLWGHDEINEKLKTNFFDYFNLSSSNGKTVKYRTWSIRGEKFRNFLDMKPYEYIESDQSIIKQDDMQMKFHFECCAKHASDSPMCAFFSMLDSLSDGIGEVNIEIEIQCDKKEQFSIIMPSNVSY